MIVATQYPEKFPFIPWKKHKLYFKGSLVSSSVYIADVKEEEEAALLLVCQENLCKTPAYTIVINDTLVIPQAWLLSTKTLLRYI